MKSNLRLVFLVVTIGAVVLMAFGMLPSAALTVLLAIILGHRAIGAMLLVQRFISIRRTHPAWLPPALCDDRLKPLPLRAACIGFLRFEGFRLFVGLMLMVNGMWLLTAIWAIPALCFAILVSLTRHRAPSMAH